METILYFYHSKDETNFITEKWKEEDYCLIRAGVPPFVWKNQWARQPACGEEILASQASVLAQVREWQQALLFLGENPNRCSCVYENFLLNRLSPNVWSPVPIPYFTDYREEQWAVKLLPYGRWNREIILGTAEYLPKLLYRRAKQMQSLQWVVREEQYTDFFQDFVEEFLEETGIAAQVHVTEHEKPMTGVFLKSEQPVNVWDFSGEKRVFVTGIPRDSIWLDMDAMEEKEERITGRNPGIIYFSLKKLWNQLQKESYCLDTTYKNGYNT